MSGQSILADQQAIITFDDVDNAIINGCFQMIPVEGIFIKLTTAVL